MKIPLKYNLRSLWVRKVGTLMTALGIGLTVAVLVTMMALVRGLDSTFMETGQEHDLIVLRKGQRTKPTAISTAISFRPFGIFRVWPKERMESRWQWAEMVVVINHPRRSGEDSNVIVRGTLSGPGNATRSGNGEGALLRKGFGRSS